MAKIKDGSKVVFDSYVVSVNAPGPGKFLII